MDKGYKGDRELIFSLTILIPYAPYTLCPLFPISQANHWVINKLAYLCPANNRS